MTREAYNKHKTEIEAWGEGIGILYFSKQYKDWRKKPEPSWSENTLYIIDDKHVEARKAFALGEPIQRRILWQQNCPSDFNKEWTDYEDTGELNLKHNGTDVEYRPKPKTKTIIMEEWLVRDLRVEIYDIWWSSDIEADLSYITGKNHTETIKIKKLSERIIEVGDD